MAHQIDGRKLGRKTGPRMALYKSLIVAVLRYEQIRTTEAKRQGSARHGRADHHARQGRHPGRPPPDRRRSCPKSRSSSTS